MPLLGRLADFRSSIEEVLQLITNAHATDASGNALWTLRETQMITEAGFLRAFVSWEAFLEASFIDYLMGEQTANGTLLTRYVFPNDRQHAINMVKSTQPYTKYNDPNNVRTLAKLFFKDGEPFESVLASIYSDLTDLNTIRNAAAHLSSNTSKQLDALASRKLGASSTGINVYNLVLSSNPASSKTVLQTYMDTLDTAAYLIVHN